MLDVLFLGFFYGACTSWLLTLEEDLYKDDQEVGLQAFGRQV